MSISSPFAPLLPPPPPPPSAPPAWSPRADASTRRLIVIGGAVTALTTALAVQAGSAGLAWTVALLVIADVVWLGVERRAAATSGLVLVVVATAIVFLVRRSTWLLAPDIAVAIGCLCWAASMSGNGDHWWHQPLSRIIDNGIQPVADVPALPSWLRRAEGADTEGARASMLGVVIGAPIAALITVLLVSADSTFASMLSRVVTGHWAAESFVGLVAAVGAAGLVRRTRREAPPVVMLAPGVDERSGVAMLRVVALPLAAFAVAQALAIAGLRDEIATTQGVTWSSSARSGFFQLLFVAAIVAALMASIRAVTVRQPHERAPRLARWGLVVCALMLVVVATALQRLAAYQGVYGLTMLRLASTTATVWVGLVFVLIGAWYAGVGHGRHWIAPAIITLTLVAVGVWNVMDPEGLVERTQVTAIANGSAAGLEISDADPYSRDGFHVSPVDDLVLAAGPDGLAALGDELHRLSEAERQQVTDLVCGRNLRAPDGFLAANVSAGRVNGLVDRLCG